MNKEEQIQKRINTALTLVDSTRSVILGSGTLLAVTGCVRELFGAKTVQLIADRNTFIAAGKYVQQLLETSGHKVNPPFIFEDPALYAEMRYVERLEVFLSGKDVVPLAVGSGTINDLTKLASERNGLKYMVVATAGSMDGYTAFGASISYKGSKQTFSCSAPVAVVVDTDIIAAAPSEMNASGYADLIAKVPSGADWIVADALGIEPIAPEAWDLTQTHLREMIANPGGISTGEKTAMLGLMEGLVMTGLGMQIFKTSRPASGAEHQFSHLWDNQHHTYNGQAPSHGFKVGIGSLSSEALYGNVLKLKADDFNVDLKAITCNWPDFAQIERQIRNDFPDKDLAVQVIEQSKAKYVTERQLLERISGLREIWLELKEKLEGQLLGAGRLREMLSAAGAPVLPEEIGIDRPRLRESYRLAQLIRQRYTVLDLVLETSHWANCVDSLFEKNGFWDKA